MSNESQYYKRTFVGEDMVDIKYSKHFSHESRSVIKISESSIRPQLRNKGLHIKAAKENACELLLQEQKQQDEELEWLEREKKRLEEERRQLEEKQELL